MFHLMLEILWCFFIHLYCDYFSYWAVKKHFKWSLDLSLCIFFRFYIRYKLFILCPAVLYILMLSFWLVYNNYLSLLLFTTYVDVNSRLGFRAYLFVLS